MKDIFTRERLLCILFSAIAGGLIGFFISQMLESGDGDLVGFTSEPYDLDKAKVESGFYRTNVGYDPGLINFDAHETFFEVDEAMMDDIRSSYQYLLLNNSRTMNSARIYFAQNGTDAASEVHLIMVGLDGSRREIENFANASTGVDEVGYRKITRPLPCPRACDREASYYPMIQP